MFWLLACASPPSLVLPVAPPSAVHATAEPVERFVGPLDIRGLHVVELCEKPDHAALLAAGRFGWRVLVLGPDGPRLADEVGEPGTADELAARTRARVEQWAAADALAAERCGAPVNTSVLVAVDGALPFDDTSLLRRWQGLESATVRLLVTDPAPGPAVAPPARKEDGYYLAIGAARQGWAVLGSSNEVRASEHRTATEAVQRVVEAGYPDVVYTADRLPWSRVTEGLDALAGIGVVPTFGFVVSDKPQAKPVPVPPPTTGTRLALGETVAVLEYAFPGYVRKSTVDGRPGSPTVILQMIGTSGDARFE